MHKAYTTNLYLATDINDLFEETSRRVLHLTVF